MAPLLRADIDTDQIIPKQFLKRVEKAGFGPYLFHDWANDGEGELRPEFVLNKPAYRHAKVLVAGRNFGSGSSREHAPWALMDWGFKAIIAPSFGDIFTSNSYNNGLLPISLAEAPVRRLADLSESDPAAEIVIDLPAQAVSAAGLEASFEIDAFVKDCLLRGLDAIDLTMASEPEITAFEGSRPGFKPAV